MLPVENPGARIVVPLLVESSLKVVLCCQLGTLFLFVATVDRLHPLLPGAMCAAGSLNASRFGYPAFAAKLLAFLLCGLWLIVNRATLGSGATVIVRVTMVVFGVAAGVPSAFVAVASVAV